MLKYRKIKRTKDENKFQKKMMEMMEQAEAQKPRKKIILFLRTNI